MCAGPRVTTDAMTRGITPCFRKRAYLSRTSSGYSDHDSTLHDSVEIHGVLESFEPPTQA